MYGKEGKTIATTKRRTRNGLGGGLRRLRALAMPSSSESSESQAVTYSTYSK